MKNEVTCRINYKNNIDVYNHLGYKIISIPFKSINLPLKKLIGYAQGCSGVYPKEKYKSFYANHGILPNNLPKIIKKYVIENVIKPHKEVIDIIRTKDVFVNVNNNLHLFENYDLVKQYCDDGLKHLSPFAFYFGKTTKEMKELVGSSTWKALCKNTFSRNKLIAKNAYEITPFSAKYERDIKDWFKVYNGFPSTLLLKRSVLHYGLQYSVIEKVKNHYKLSFKKMVSDRVAIRDIQEFRDLLLELGDKFDSNWTYRRMKEEHTKMIQEKQRFRMLRIAQENKEYAVKLETSFREIHPALSNLSTEDFDGVIVKPLTVYKDVITEGDEQHHCVGMYADSCLSGKYLVFSLRNESGRSTLGLSVKKHTSPDGKTKMQYNLDQHYGKYNGIIDDEKLNKAVTKIIELLNKPIV